MSIDLDANDNIVVSARDRTIGTAGTTGTSHQITITSDTARLSEDLGERDGGDRLALTVPFWPDVVVDKEANANTLIFHP